jgi:hypothetical protein
MHTTPHHSLVDKRGEAVGKADPFDEPEGD